MKYLWGIIGVVLVIAIGTSVWYSSVANERANEGVEVTTHVKGNPDAEVTLTEYSDFQCPACAQFYPVVNDVMEQYGDQLRFEYKHFPLISIHPLAEPAARAAEAAGQQGKFFEYHDMLFENQGEWSSGGVASQYFEEYARELELDIEQFNRHMRSSLLADKIRSDLGEARQNGYTGTPTFELNGERMSFESFEGFLGQIQDALGVEATSTLTEASTSSDATSSDATSGSNVRFGF